MQRIVDIETCPVLSPDLQESFHQVRAALVLLGELAAGITGIELTRIDSDSGTIAVLNPRDSPPPAWPHVGEKLRELCTSITAVCVQVPKRNRTMTSCVGQPTLYGQTPEGQPVTYAARGFIQGNLSMADRLCEAVCAGVVMAVGQQCVRVVELYAGSGLLSWALASKGHKVTASELNPVDVDAALNLPAPPHGTLTFARSDASRFLTEYGSKEFEVLVIDPPRSGLKGLGSQVATHGPQAVVGVWCSPDAMARDVEILSRSYRVLAITALDLFPQTDHVETVVVFAR